MNLPGDTPAAGTEDATAAVRAVSVAAAAAAPLAATAPDAREETPFHRIAADFAASKLALFGLALFALIVLCAVLAPLISPQNPYDLAQLDVLDSRLEPGARSGDGKLLFWLGTDDQGRDMLSAIFYGLRISIGVGVTATLCALAIGTTLGLAAAFFGGRTDSLIMRVADIQLSFPAILIALILLAVLGQGVDKIIVALVAVQWAYYARTVRGSALVERSKDYMEAARCLALPRRAHRVPAPAAELPAAADRRRDGAGRGGDRARGDAVVPRPRRCRSPSPRSAC